MSRERRQIPADEMDDASRAVRAVGVYPVLVDDPFEDGAVGEAVLEEIGEMLARLGEP